MHLLGAGLTSFVSPPEYQEYFFTPFTNLQTGSNGSLRRFLRRLFLRDTRHTIPSASCKEEHKAAATMGPATIVQTDMAKNKTTD